jgi:hypothetical protein
VDRSRSIADRSDYCALSIRIAASTSASASSSSRSGIGNDGPPTCWRNRKNRWTGSSGASGCAALASAAGPSAVEVEGFGLFHREYLPLVTVPVGPPEPHDGWLPAVSRGPSGGSGELRLEAYHRYVRYLG